MEKVMGFRLVPKKTNSSTKLHFDVWITQASPAEGLFYTSPAARRAISKFSADTNVNKKTGSITYTKSKSRLKREPIYSYLFFPFTEPFIDTGNERETKLKIFEKQGIALNLERIALRELLKVSPNAVLYPAYGVTEHRKRQMANRGINAVKLLDAQEVYTNILSNIRRFRKTKRITLPQARKAFAMQNGLKLRKGRGRK
jgi:hypothetical protein